jgi:hypothetical protein
MEPGLIRHKQVGSRPYTDTTSTPPPYTVLNPRVSLDQDPTKGTNSQDLSSPRQAKLDRLPWQHPCESSDSDDEETRQLIPPGLLITPPSPATVESFAVLDDIAWDQSQRGGRTTSQRSARTICLAAAAAFVAATLFATAWGFFLFGIYHG